MTPITIPAGQYVGLVVFAIVGLVAFAFAVAEAVVDAWWWRRYRRNLRGPVGRGKGHRRE